MQPANKRTAIIIGAALFFTYAYFYQAGGWNQNSRFALIRAIIERHTLKIDAYQLHTGDRAFFEGHYYTDKAPGASLIALGPVAAARGIDRLVGVDPEGFPGLAWTSYVASVVTSAVFTAIAALVVFFLCLEWGYSRPAATFAALAYGLATPAWAFATLFMEHGLTAGCLMLAFAFAERRRASPRDEWLVGAWTGLAVVCELQSSIPAAFIVALALANTRSDDRTRLPAAALRIVSAGFVVGLVFFAYNTLAFGSPFHVGYASEEGFEHLRSGFFGITTPSLLRLAEILSGRYRGLVPLAPVIAAMPLGVILLWQVPARRLAVLTIVAIATFYFLLNASYYYWEGGWSYAPRQVTPALPFLTLGLAPLWDAWKRAGRAVLLALTIVGVGFALVAVSTTPQPPSNLRWPMVDLLWPAFRDGDLSINTQTFVHNGLNGELRNNPSQHAAWNLGQLAGLNGHASLIPLGVVWGVAGAVLLL